MHKYRELGTTLIAMAAASYVACGAGLKKFQASRFLLGRVYVGNKFGCDRRIIA